MYCSRDDNGELTIKLCNAMDPQSYVFGLLDVANAAALQIANNPDSSNPCAGDVAMGLSSCFDLMHALLNEVYTTE